MSYGTADALITLSNNFKRLGVFFIKYLYVSNKEWKYLDSYYLISDFGWMNINLMASDSMV